MKNQFNEFIKSVSPYTPLPLVHSTESVLLPGLIKDKQLKPVKGPVFEDDLVYLYYGRPAYRVAQQKEPSGQKLYLPVCFILKSDCVLNLKRIYPFDSGAFKNNLYNDHIPQDTFNLDDYWVEPLVEMPRHVVAAFFKSNEKYYIGEPNNSITIPPTKFSVWAFYSLITNLGFSSEDDRRATVELQTTTPITLSKDTVEAVVLPREFLEDADILTTLIDWGASLITYQNYHHCKPDQYVVMIFDKVFQYFKDKHYI